MDEMNFTKTENRIYEEILKNVKQHKKKTVADSGKGGCGTLLCYQGRQKAGIFWSK